MARKVEFWGFAQCDDFRDRDRTPPMFRGFAPRATKRAKKDAVEVFRAWLASHLPMGENAVAMLECRASRGTETLVSVKGRVTSTRVGRDGYSRVPATGEWIDHDGCVFAVFGGDQ